MVNIGDLWSRTKRSKAQYNIGAGKEIIFLIYELNVSHSTWINPTLSPVDTLARMRGNRKPYKAMVI